jgi:hypothetical protein
MRRCRLCYEPFEPKTPGYRWCSWTCRFIDDPEGATREARRDAQAKAKARQARVTRPPREGLMPAEIWKGLLQLCQTGRLHHWMCVFDGHWFSYGSRLPFTRGFIPLTADKSLGGYAINGCSEAHVDQWSQLEEAPDMAQTSQRRADYERKINALRRTGGLGIAR